MDTILECRTAAYHILWEQQHYPFTRLQVVHVLQNTKNSYTAFSALQVFEGVIKYRWNALPVDQRDRLRNYISKDIVELSSYEASLRVDKLYIHKLNIILVQILKHEWPGRWTSFIPELVSAAKINETICENCMAILKLLSEEVLDFSRVEMKQKNIMELKHSLNSDFQCIHELCLCVLSDSQSIELIRATLSTLHAFLSWIPSGCIFETLLEKLLKLFPMPSYLNLTLQCLTKVATLNFGDSYNLQYVKMYNIFMAQLQAKLPPTDIPLFYAKGLIENKAFIENLALFLTTFYKSHARILESTSENRTSLLLGLEYLINISYVKDNEIFKVCLEYWRTLASELSEAHDNLANPAAMVNMMGMQICLSPGIVDCLASHMLQRLRLYAGPMSKLMILISHRMSGPEEFFTVEDENGSIACETMKCEDVLVQYKK